jgi:hypothetical protein
MATSKPNPYVPSFLRAAMSGSRPLTLTWSDVQDTNIASTTSSFQYDQGTVGIKSSQQLNVDWSQFQNHTFFMSAEAKVNLAFDSIINGYPFDGTRRETEVFFEIMTGFDKWVFDNFPTYRGELMFSGTQVGETSPSAGTYILVENKTGALFPELSDNNGNNSSGLPLLNPTGSTSMTVEMQLFVPARANDVQVVFQMVSSSAGLGVQGFQFYLTQSLSTTSVEGFFSVVSGSSYMTVPVMLNKGMFNHVALELNRDNGLPFLESFLLSAPVAESATQIELGDLAIDGAQFIIGSGTQMQVGSQVVIPRQTLSGTIDEFRVFHSARTPLQQASYAAKAIYSTKDLVLYYRFNEPGPPLAATLVDPINSIVLDSSGNSFHALISNFSTMQGSSSSIYSTHALPASNGSADAYGVVVSSSILSIVGNTYTAQYFYAVGPELRLDASADPLSPIIYERADTVPVLFPAYPPVVAFNAELLASATLYDQENPNLITKMVPQHYFLEGGQQDGFIDPIEGNASQPYGGSGIPGQGVMGSSQIMVSLLYVWARFFDEIKLFVDQFATLKTVDYDTGEVAAPDTVPDNFLINLVQNMGFHLPPLFNDSSIDQYVRGENIDLQDYTTSNLTLKQVQSLLLRRVLVNLPDVLRSKGTQHSIRSFLRATGIDPGNNVRIREFGGPTTQNLAVSRETKIEPGVMAQFPPACTVVSPFLSASRVEPGFPSPVGTFKYDPHGHAVGTNNLSDGLLTSGSWTWEGIVKYTPIAIKTYPMTTQSLVRFCVTGSTGGTGPGIIANLLAISSSLQPVGPKLVLYIRPGAATTSPLLRLELDTPMFNVFTGDKPLGIFDSNRWNVSFGCQRGDDGLNTPVSSSYFLRLAYQNDGEIQYLETTSSFFQECPLGEANALQKLSSTANASGTYLAVGTTQFIASGNSGQYLFLNSTSGVPDEARATAFGGRLSNFRFWSRALALNEWEEHVRNYNSVGVEDPLTNWNYATMPSGSWGRLRLNAMIAQDNRQAISTGSIALSGPPNSIQGPTGSFVFIDFSENGFHLTGSGFPINQDILAGEFFDFSYLSPYFDEASTNQKVRVRSYQDFDLVEETPWAALAPVYEVVKSEAPTDDVRFIIEFSLIDALNRDIVAIFATFDALDNALGAPELVFSADYPDLENLRNVYFNRVKQRLNFQAFFEFFRWFDTAVGTFITQLIPRKTRFKGTNFTVESHMLERAKHEYLTYDIYLGDSNRTNLNAELLLQQVAGTIRKF